MNPWLIAAIAAGALWLLTRVGGAAATPMMPGESQAAQDAAAAGDSGTVVALPPGQGGSSVGQTLTSSTLPGGPSIDSSIGAQL